MCKTLDVMKKPSISPQLPHTTASGSVRRSSSESSWRSVISLRMSSHRASTKEDERIRYPGCERLKPKSADSLHPSLSSTGAVATRKNLLTASAKERAHSREFVSRGLLQPKGDAFKSREGHGDQKENRTIPILITTKSESGGSASLRPRPRILSQRDTNIFRFSHVDENGVQPKGVAVDCAVPRISVCLDDDVFFDTQDQVHHPPPPSCRLLLTPSTTYSPRPSSCTSLYLEHSPNIALGIQCNTPSRLRLESEGLGSDKLVLGRGAYGTVVLGQWRGRKVAVKVMEKEEGARSARRRKSLESELQALKLDHDNIVKVHGVFAAKNKYAVIIMEYVGSRNLHRLLIETPDKHLGRSWLLGVGRQLSSALAHCHARGVLHLDVKPANVLVTSSGGCKLGDFGCSTGVDSPHIPLEHSLVGTPGYQAPEFLRGDQPQPACDVYSLGILLWQLDSREVPFQGQHPQTIMFRTVSAGARPQSTSSPCIGIPTFHNLYRSCWAQDPLSRPTAAIVHIRLMNLISTLHKSAHILRVKSAQIRL